MINLELELEWKQQLQKFFRLDWKLILLFYTDEIFWKTIAKAKEKNNDKIKCIFLQSKSFLFRSRVEGEVFEENVTYLFKY